jgi:hypothetical protein
MMIQVPRSVTKDLCALTALIEWVTSVMTHFLRHVLGGFWVANPRGPRGG